MLLTQLYSREQTAAGIQMKAWGDPTTISSNDCPVCLVQGVEIIHLSKEEKKGGWAKTRKYNYHDVKSFEFEPKMFEQIKYLGKG